MPFEHFSSIHGTLYVFSVSTVGESEIKAPHPLCSLFLFPSPTLPLFTAFWRLDNLSVHEPGVKVKMSDIWKQPGAPDLHMHSLWPFRALWGEKEGRVASAHLQAAEQSRGRETMDGWSEENATKKKRPARTVNCGRRQGFDLSSVPGLGLNWLSCRPVVTLIVNIIWVFAFYFPSLTYVVRAALVSCAWLTLKMTLHWVLLNISPTKGLFSSLLLFYFHQSQKAYKQRSAWTQGRWQAVTWSYFSCQLLFCFF